VVLPRDLPADTYSVAVIANGVSSASTSFTWSGPIYDDDRHRHQQRH
jgi:hypothetical protein